MEKLTKEQINEVIKIAKEINKDHEKADKWAPEEIQEFMKVARNNLIASLGTILTLNNL